MNVRLVDSVGYIIPNATGYYDDNGSVSERISEMIPSNVNLVYWDYFSKDYNRYSNQIKKHLSIKDDIWFAGGLWSWIGFAPHNEFSMNITKAAFDACRDNGVKDVILTMWGDNGAECSKFSLLPSLYYASQIAHGVTDLETIKNGFKEKYGIDFDDFMLVDLPGYGFASNKGYGSASHIQAIKEIGVTPIHRQSFIKNFI